ncbi:hypothetical protein HPB52_013531 [Rhipicephalus sanguineus]|uniref:Uncharacterized protein n=1 Tax=Rhipicephalus sanguineus TaxID=34632 RepID=A0A9D4Q6T3_RHISA|nr:hypothetical protein HPB52_013531 [Rhipicephalus sanguineus]
MYISWLRRRFPGSAPSETRGGVGRNISVSASYNRAVGASQCVGLGQRRQQASAQRARGSDLGLQVLATDCDSAELNDPTTMVFADLNGWRHPRTVLEPWERDLRSRVPCMNL